MYLYTIEPLDRIFPYDEDKGSALSVQLSSNSIVQGHRSEADTHQMVVDRIISTDPKLYLDKRYRPGAIIKL